MNPAIIIDTLKSLSAFGGRVLVVSDMQAALEAVKPFAAMPCCILHGITEKAGDNRLSTGGPSQPITVSVRILTIHRDVSDAYGTAAMSALSSTLITMKAALLGIIPDTEHDELLYVSGQIAYANAGTLAWLDEWRTRYDLRTIS